MSNKESLIGFDSKLLDMFWFYVQRLRDPVFVSKFQNYFGVRIVTKDNFKSNQFKTKLKAKTSKLLNGFHETSLENIHQFSEDQKNGDKTETKQNYSLQTVGHKRSLSESSSLCSSTLDNTSEDELSSSSETIDYVIESRFWYYLFSFGASLGYELFYASFFPIWFWNIDSAVGRRLVLVWVIVMYFGQTLKDVVKWPRPTSPPVVVLEPEYANEYGMPSTHAMVGSALPFSLIYFTVNRYEYSLWIGVIFAIFWCVLVCTSRLYLGMHSIIDLVAGLLLTAFLMIIIIPLVDAIDQFHLTSSYSPFITIPLIVFLATVYPKSDRWSPARGDTCVIMGSGAGILLGAWLNYQLGIMKGPALPPPFPIMWPGYEVIGLSLLRLSIGILCIVAARAIGKVFVFSLLCYIRNLDPRDPKIKIRASVEIPCKVITYILMGLTITYLSPVVFRFLNIERVTMFTEI